MHNNKKPRVIETLIGSLLKEVFVHSVGSWGAFPVDEDGNFIEQSENIKESEDAVLNTEIRGVDSK